MSTIKAFQSIAIRHVLRMKLQLLGCIAKPALLITILFLANRICFAGITIAAPNTIIDKDTKYTDITLDLNHGSFQIKNNATLTIANSKINGTISPENPFLIYLSSGNLILNNNTFNLTTDRIPAIPNLPSLYYVINLGQGGADIKGNRFEIDKPYTVGLLDTNRNPTSEVNFKDNHIRNFHGGILLRNSNHAIIVNNKFSNVSSSNIFIIEGSDNLINRNTILFSGNNNIGDGVDIYDSNNITLSENYISSGSCYSVLISNSKNIIIDRNKIIGGVTYALYLAPLASSNILNHEFISQLIGKQNIRTGLNENITVTNNYLSQNRYGLAASNVVGLTVKNNIFIQRFSDSKSRKFWTNNDVLLQNTSNVIWDNNLYKEGYSQEIHGDNLKSSRFVLFPLHGGVIL